MDFGGEGLGLGVDFDGGAGEGFAEGTRGEVVTGGGRGVGEAEEAAELVAGGFGEVGGFAAGVAHGLGAGGAEGGGGFLGTVANGQSDVVELGGDGVKDRVREVGLQRGAQDDVFGGLEAFEDMGVVFVFVMRGDGRAPGSEAGVGGAVRCQGGEQG